jgi:hypothetical protein
VATARTALTICVPDVPELDDDDEPAADLTVMACAATDALASALAMAGTSIDAGSAVAMALSSPVDEQSPAVLTILTAVVDPEVDDPDDPDPVRTSVAVARRSDELSAAASASIGPAPGMMVPTALMTPSASTDAPVRRTAVVDVDVLADPSAMAPNSTMTISSP